MSIEGANCGGVGEEATRLIHSATDCSSWSDSPATSSTSTLFEKHIPTRAAVQAPVGTLQPSVDHHHHHQKCQPWSESPSDLGRDQQQTSLPRATPTTTNTTTTPTTTAPQQAHHHHHSQTQTQTQTQIQTHPQTVTSLNPSHSHQASQPLQPHLYHPGLLPHHRLNTNSSPQPLLSSASSSIDGPTTLFLSSSSSSSSSSSLIINNFTMAGSPQSASTASTPTGPTSLSPDHTSLNQKPALTRLSSPSQAAVSPPAGSAPSHAAASRPTAELSRAEAIGLYRTGNLSNLPPRAVSPTASRTDHLSSRASSSSINTTTTSGRRPRAGTMPSSFSNPSLSSPVASSPLSLVNAHPSARPEILRQLNLLTAVNTLNSSGHHLSIGGPATAHGSLSMPGSGGSTPIGSDLNLRLSLDKTRARAGTVALPPSSASSYFGRGVFATNFVPRSSRMNEELRSIRSDESTLGEGELQTEAGHVRTLDYLGLDADSPVSPTVPNPPQSAFATSGFYQQLLNGYNQAVSAGHPNPSLSALANRMRASTVSGMTPSPAPGLRTPSTTRLQPAFSANEGVYAHPHSGANSPGLLDEDYTVPLGSANSLVGQYATGRVGRIIRSADPMQAEAHDQPMSAYPSLLTPTSSTSLLGSNRPRAMTLAGASLLAGASGGLSPSGAGLSAAAAAAVRHRAGTLAGLSQHGGYLGTLANEGPDGGVGYVSMDNLGNWMSGSRPLTPDLGLSMTQLPSRTLWIGNLDPSTTAQELMNVFAVYGAIESLRLLPDKQCGIINFVSVHDAAHAKDDVLNRLEGQINLAKGPSYVRVAFGQPESAPPTPVALMSNSNPGLAQAMMMLSLNHMQTANGLISSSQINNILPNPNGHVNVGGILIGPNGDPVLQSNPSRALWIASISSQTTPNHLMEIFSPYGQIESARVLTHKSCGFITYQALDDAVRARKALNGREIFGKESGVIKIGYAKVPPKGLAPYSPATNPHLDNLAPGSLTQQQLTLETLARIRSGSVGPLDQQILSAGLPDYRTNLAMGFLPNGIHALNGFQLAAAAVAAGSASSTPIGFPPTATTDASGASLEPDQAQVVTSALMPSPSELEQLMVELCGENDGLTEAEQRYLAEFRPTVNYFTSVPPPINQLDPHRRLVSAASDPSRLREIRKRIDSNSLSQDEMDQLATELMEEIVYLSSDYIGNTIVQKFFEKCSQPLRMMMLERCAAHLAIIGCHKNGTWAAQKIIDTATQEEEMKIICQSLRPFGPPLLLDSLGNYVMQCCLRFGSPHNDFVYDALVDRCWEVAQGRFGARSMRTCLESKHVSRIQIKRVAIAVVLNSKPLVTNPNGTLLINWLLETSGFIGRYKMLARRLISNLGQFCTHKLALVTVLKIINQSADKDASEMILEGLFEPKNQNVLEEVLGDQVHGINILTKILASSFIGTEEKAKITERIKQVMMGLRLQHLAAYKKFADELGITSNASSGMMSAAISPSRSNSSPGGNQTKNWTPKNGGTENGIGVWNSPSESRNNGGLSVPASGSSRSSTPSGNKEPLAVLRFEPSA